MSIAAILLAAGASTRMGAPKPLLPWGGKCLLAWELDQLLASCVDEIVVVTGSRADDVRRALGPGGARYCVFNPLWPQGRSTSLVCGVRTLLNHGGSPPEAIVIQNVDQPTRADIIDRLVDEMRRAGAKAAQPEHGGHGGHPVVVSSALIGDLLAAREATLGLRGALEAYQVYRVPMEDEPVVALNLNNPETLTEARRLLGVGDG